MKLTLTIEIDGTDEYCEAVLDELETAVDENEIIEVKTGGGIFEAAIIAVEEQAAVGRPKGGTS